MAVIITYFPHGSSTDNERGIGSGWLDPELSELGVKQALELKDAIKERTFDVVFCSDLRRAVDTAKLAFADTMNVIADSRLRECNYGEYNGRPASEIEAVEEKHINEKFPSGESYEDVKKRVNDLLGFLKEGYDGKAVALVAHRAPQLALEVLLKGRAWREALAEDWRKTRAWQAGWDYVME